MTRIRGSHGVDTAVPTAASSQEEMLVNHGFLRLREDPVFRCLGASQQVSKHMSLKTLGRLFSALLRRVGLVASLPTMRRQHTPMLGIPQLVRWHFVIFGQSVPSDKRLLAAMPDIAFRQA